MSCAICGKDNQPGTRFCVHCGAALAPPSTSPMIGGAALTSATAAVARPAMPAASAGVATSATAARPAAPPREFSVRPAGPAPSVPAYDTAPKVALPSALIGVLALVAVAGGIAYMLLGRVADEEQPSLPPATSPAPAEPRPAEPRLTAPATLPEPAEPVEPSTAEPKADDAKTTVPEAPRAPPTPPKAETKAAAPKAAAPPPLPPAKSAAPATAPPTPTAPDPRQRATTTVPAAPVQDRWTQFAEELRNCHSETFLNRVICDQRVRLRYCDGYWNKVPQCPGGVANPDR
jgi:hypothetical protein